MSELSDILKEEYIKETQRLDLGLLMSMIEEAVDEALLQPVEEDEAPNVSAASDEETIEMILKMIPNIEVSEIGWSDVKTPGDGDAAEIKGPQRKLLEGYLNNIQGSDFAEKIRSVSQFYSNGIGMVESQAGNDRTKRISQAISYLVFYKTLTKVITNFNASSAGFSFESFLAALVNGFQIPANTGTIADYVAAKRFQSASSCTKKVIWRSAAAIQTLLEIWLTLNIPALLTAPCDMLFAQKH
mgnify:CR=1 FL=1